MIRVTMELLPGGMDLGDDNELLGVIHISNDLSTSLSSKGQRGTYLAEIFKKRRGVIWTKLWLKDFPRQSYHPWEMVRRILNQAAEGNGGHI